MRFKGKLQREFNYSLNPKNCTNVYNMFKDPNFVLKA